jgi:NAD(P)-dependent dehydrogenase (short-subunit alcohol dehydrogenase family)
VNYLATVLLALLLIPALKASPSNPHTPVMSFVASWSIFPAHFTMKPPKTDSYLKHLCANKGGVQQQGQYGRSKLLCLYFLRELASRIPSSKLIINSFDPGTAWTQLTAYNKHSAIQRFFMRISQRPIETCSKTLVNAVQQDDKTHGRLMVDYDVVK